MKNKQTFLKLIAVFAVAVLLVLSLASCAMGGASAANDASGEHGTLKWEYKKDGQTLTITGSGAMEDFADTESVAWADVVTSVKKLVVGDGITTVGDYAFFGMSALTEVKLPSSLKSIGKLSFAFTSSLEAIEIPDSVTSIGYGAFETSGIKAIALPAALTAVSDRTFMYCNDLVSVVGAGVKTVGAEAFSYCTALESIKLAEGATAADSAFANAKIDKSKITVADNKITITYKFVDAADGVTEIKAAESVSKDAGAEAYIYKSPAIDGYTAVEAERMVTPGDIDQTITISYNKIEVETEPVETEPVETEPDDGKLEPLTVVALVVTVIIIIAIIVGTVLFIRNDRKNAGKGSTVRKNKDDKKSKKDKK